MAARPKSAALMAAGLIFLGSAAFATPIESGQVGTPANHPAASPPLHPGAYKAEEPIQTEISKIDQLKALAEKGDASAEYELGRIYESEIGGLKDYKSSAEWFRKASLQGDHKAQLHLSLLYAKGLGVPQDDKQGAYWMSKAGEGLSPQQQQALTMLYGMARVSYSNGRALSENEMAKKSASALQMRADRGDAHAKCALYQTYAAHPELRRPEDNLTVLKGICVQLGYINSGRPPPPALALPSSPVH